MVTFVTPRPFTSGFLGGTITGEALNAALSADTSTAQSAITALAGGARTGAPIMNAVYNRVDTVASAGDSVVLPSASPGAPVTVLNNGANALTVYGNGSDTINGIAGATGILLQPGAIAQFTPFASGAYITESANSQAVTGRSIFQSVPIGSVAYASFGNNTTLVSGTMYVSEITVTRNFTATGIAVLIGLTGGTNNGLVALYPSQGGAAIATSALAGAIVGTASTIQSRNFISTIALQGPARYWIGYQQNGTTATLATIAANTFVDTFTTSFTGAFGTVTALTSPTSFTANVGPIGYLF